jgi:hypothetical protein
MNYSEVETVIKIFCGGFRVLFESSTLTAGRFLWVEQYNNRARERSLTKIAR